MYFIFDADRELFIMQKRVNTHQQPEFDKYCFVKAVAILSSISGTAHILRINSHLRNPSSISLHYYVTSVNKDPGKIYG